MDLPNLLYKQLSVQLLWWILCVEAACRGRSAEDVDSALPRCSYLLAFNTSHPVFPDQLKPCFVLKKQ